MKISVIIPVYNEAENLSELYIRLTNALMHTGLQTELVFVNDGSQDRTQEILEILTEKDNHVHYIELSRNFGHQIAVTAGMEHCTGDYIVIIDGDLQDPPELIGKLYEKLQEGYDVVYARRKKRKNESIFKKATAKIFYRLLKRITYVEVPVDTGDFRIITRRVADVLMLMPEQQKFLRGQIAWAGFRHSYISYDRDGRKSGETAYSYGKMMRFAKDGITSLSDFPIKLVSWSGFVVAFFAFLVMLYALYSKFILKGAVPGWASLMISMLFIGGVQLISIGVIGEYISRIAQNVRNRPLYVINRKKVPEEKKDSTKEHDVKS